MKKEVNEQKTELRTEVRRLQPAARRGGDAAQRGQVVAHVQAAVRGQPVHVQRVQPPGGDGVGGRQLGVETAPVRPSAEEKRNNNERIACCALALCAHHAPLSTRSTCSLYADRRPAISA